MLSITEAHKKLYDDNDKLFKLVQKEQLKRIRRRTPYNNGTARDSWKINGADIVSDVEYVKFLEYGTKSVHPHGMVRKTQLETDSIIKQQLRNIK